MFITSKNKYLSNDIKIFGTCSIPLTLFLELQRISNLLLGILMLTPKIETM